MIGTLQPNPYLVVKETADGRGRGVFAAREYVQGEAVEVSPVWLIDMRWEDLPHSLKLVVYDWGVLAQTPSPTCAVALGVGSLFNHSTAHNLKFQALPEQKAIEFVALRDIDLGEELLVDYNSDMGDSGASWFDLVGVVER